MAKEIEKSKSSRGTFNGTYQIKEETIEERAERLENEVRDLIDVDNKKPNVVVNIDDDVMNEDPFDDRFFINDANKTEIIQYFEKSIIRPSFEYKWFIDMLKRTLDVKACVFFKGYSIDNGMKLQFHHHPFTLYDYTEAVVNKQKAEHEEGFVYENEVCKEVAKLHYRLMVGLVPLDPTSHQQVHDHVLDIPPQLVIGHYEKFFQEYNEFIPEETKCKYTDWLTTNHEAELEVPSNFKYKPTIINAFENRNAITIEQIDKLLLEDKMSKINNEYIAKLLSEDNGGKK
jgi:hypothetical protein